MSPPAPDASAAASVRPLRPLFPPTTRLFGVCLVVGVLGAFAALGFEWLVEAAGRLLLGGVGRFEPPAAGVLAPAVELPGWPARWWLPVATTLGGLVSGWLVFRFAPEAEGHGTDAAIAAYHRGASPVPARVPVVKAIASAVTIGSGGVAGREGPAAQISVGLGSLAAQALGLRGQERRIVLLAAMAAGLAAVFKAPLGMAIFAVEILYAGMVFEAEALIYTIVAAVSAYAVHGFFAGWEPVFAIPAGLGFRHPATLAAYAALGLVAGLVGAAMPTLFYRVRDLFARLPGPPHWKPALGGLLVGLLGMAVPEVLGTGYGWVELALAGTLPLGTLVVLLLLKAPAMSLTIGSGGSGGVFGPTVVIGALLGGATGLAFERLLPGLETNPAAFVVVGMAAVFAGAARTPISTLIMTAEMTGGYGLIVPTMLANVLAFTTQRSLTATARYPTLYRSQVASREDSPAHRGVFVRRALELIEGGQLDRHELTLPRLVGLLRYGQPIPVSEGGELLVAVKVEEGSALAGATVAESLGTLTGATAVAVLRDGETLIPRGPTRFAAGDQLIAIATADAKRRLEAAAAAAGS
ncbi:MAG TPA: chloride channel protein [Thermoanaerobaculia bacterium]